MNLEQYLAALFVISNDIIRCLSLCIECASSHFKTNSFTLHLHVGSARIAAVAISHHVFDHSSLDLRSVTCFFYGVCV